LKWTVTNIDFGTALTGVSCPKTTLCVASTGTGFVHVATNPTGGAGAWDATSVDSGHQLLGISCPTSSLCVGTDETGNVVTSTNPTGGESAWTVTSVDSGNSLNAVSCASTTLCVAVDALGNALTSSNPTGGASAWTLVSAIDDNGGFDGVSCPAVGLCVAVDNSGYLVVGTSPPSVKTGSAGAISLNAASLAGTVNPNGLSVSDCHFSYGIGTPAGLSAPCSALPGAGKTDVAVGASLSGLTPNATYKFRLVATSAGGTAMGAIGTFTTALPPCVVPKLKGKTLSAAKRSLTSHRCRLGTVKRAVSRTVKKGHVISQKPRPGKRLTHGARVNLVISRGKH
jgi:hypothetical protein